MFSVLVLFVCVYETIYYSILTMLFICISSVHTAHKESARTRVQHCRRRRLRCICYADMVECIALSPDDFISHLCRRRLYACVYEFGAERPRRLKRPPAVFRSGAKESQSSYLCRWFWASVRVGLCHVVDINHMHCPVLSSSSSSSVCVSVCGCNEYFVVSSEKRAVYLQM